MTMPDSDKRAAARELRATGQSLQEVANAIGASKASVSVWVRDLVLSPDAMLAIQEKQNSARKRSGVTNRARLGDKREKFREEGRVAARQGDGLHLKGCMLYWAEGTKDASSLHFCNSDAVMMKLFLEFLSVSLGIKNKDLKVRVYCYDDVNNVEAILEHWNSVIDRPGMKMLSPIVNRYPQLSTKKRIGKLPFGTCHVRIHGVHLTQHVYGALEVYCGAVFHPVKQHTPVVQLAE